MNGYTKNKKTGKLSQRGFTLLIAVVTTSMLLLVSFVVSNIALKQIILANAGEQSQHAFYAADRGLECAVYWDLAAGPVSQFATGTAGTIRCSDEEITTDSQNVPTNSVGVLSRIGGGGSANPTSIFVLQGLNNECAIVSVTKNADNTTTIDSRGYNTCDVTSTRRFERGVQINY